MTCIMEGLGTDLPADCARRQKVGLDWIKVEATDGSSMNRVAKDE